MSPVRWHNLCCFLCQKNKTKIEIPVELRLCLTRIFFSLEISWKAIAFTVNSLLMTIGKFGKPRVNANYCLIAKSDPYWSAFFCARLHIFCISFITGGGKKTHINSLNSDYRLLLLRQTAVESCFTVIFLVIKVTVSSIISHSFRIYIPSTIKINAARIKYGLFETTEAKK